jgi:hypothetical protein
LKTGVEESGVRSRGGAGGGGVSKLTEFQIYAMIRKLEATAEMRQAGGRVQAAERARRRAAEYRLELSGRLKARVAKGERMPDQFREMEVR